MANPENFYNQRASTSDVQAGTPLSSQAYSERSLNQQPGGTGSTRDVSALGFPSTDSLLDHTSQPGSVPQHVGAAFDDALSQSGSMKDLKKAFAADLKAMPDIPADMRHDLNKHFIKDARLALKDHTLKSGQPDSVDGFIDDLKGRIEERASYLESTTGGEQANSHGDKRHGHHGGHKHLTAGADGNNVTASSESEGDQQGATLGHKRKGHHGGHRGVVATDTATSVATTGESGSVNNGGEGGINVVSSGAESGYTVASNDASIATTSNQAISDTSQTVLPTTQTSSNSQNGLYG